MLQDLDETCALLHLLMSYCMEQHACTQHAASVSPSCRTLERQWRSHACVPCSSAGASLTVGMMFAGSLAAETRGAVGWSLPATQ